MMQYQFRPIDQWPGEFTRGRKTSPFKAAWTNTLYLLETELRMLGATNIVIQAAVGEGEIKRDGMLYERARPNHPGIILSFDSKHGPLAYPCDRYSDWQANVRAIALALEALRAVDRYGVTRRAEQYKGWAKLPGQVMVVPMTPQQAAGVLVSKAATGETKVSRQNLDSLYRAACTKTHPDAGGNAEDFKRVQEAKEVLDKHFSGTAA